MKPLRLALRALLAWLLAAALLLGPGCSGSGWDGLLFDFESEAELDHFHWKCGQLFSLANEHATHGDHSLRLEIFPAPYRGLRPAVAQGDWSAFRALCLDVYNPQGEPVPLSVRIDDGRDRLEYADRYNRRFTLAPGPNRIRIPLGSLVTSGTGRRLDVADIWAFYAFLAHPKARTVLYFDYIHLE